MWAAQFTKYALLQIYKYFDISNYKILYDLFVILVI